MSGLTTIQQWRHDHIIRCTCGAWLMVSHRQLEGHAPVACPHIDPDIIEESA